MLKDANGGVVPAARANPLPPGIHERAQSLREDRMRAVEIKSLKDQIRSDLAEAQPAGRQGHALYAATLETSACAGMRRLIELGAF